MEQAMDLLVKYCFSEIKVPLSISNNEYYSSIITALESDGIIKNVRKYECESPFGWEPDIRNYETESFDTYVYTFDCNENRDNLKEMFTFAIKFTYETHSSAEILYVEICSNNYIFSGDGDSNCLEILKHKLRNKITNWENRYCLVDKQSAFYASKLYPRIYEIENFFRYYVNDVFIKVFGANWWNENVAINIKKNRKERIDDTREYAGAYKDIQPYLLSLELGDLMTIAKTKTLKWTPEFNSKIENALNHFTNEDITAILRTQCQIQIDIWNMCFAKHLSESFSDNYKIFEKRRNQVAHNKLLDCEAFKSILTLCDKILADLTNAHNKFCQEFISEEEQELVEQYKADLIEQDAMEQEALDAIAESESGVKVYSNEQIVDLFNDALYDLFNDLEQIFNDRQDIIFGKYFDLELALDKHLLFEMHYQISNVNIRIYSQLDINSSPSETSYVKLIFKADAYNDEMNISFVNGEYCFNSEQTCYMPETKDELDVSAIEKAKQDLCNHIEELFPNLREEADTRNHLEAMGKTLAITERDVYCCECGEEYICIDEEIAPIGTCLNCGAKNHIIYCTHCECPIEAVDIDDIDKEQHYCTSCNGKLFGND